MKLTTKEVEKLFRAHPIGSQDGLGMDALVLVKYFDPTGRYTLFVTEAEETLDPQHWLLFGYCISPLGEDCDEWGYVDLDELQALKGRFGLGIERDMWLDPSTTVRQALKLLGVEK